MTREILGRVKPALIETNYKINVTVDIKIKEQKYKKKLWNEQTKY